MISNYIEYMFDYTYFYDYDCLHLNSEGADLRTKQLIKDLKRWQKTGSDMSMEADANLSHITNVMWQWWKMA